MPITSPGNDDDTGENHQPTLRKNTAEPVEQTLKQNTHPRSYGDKPTDSGDPSSQLGLLCDRPAAWRNSRVRDAMPDPLREWIDAQDEATRRDSLRALLHADGESGWRAAVAGMLEILESTGGTDRAGVCLAAARHASGLGPVAYDDPVDLSEYDIAYTKEDE